MNNQKAIDELQERIDLIDQDYEGKVPEYKDALLAAVSALRKQQPRRPKKKVSECIISYSCYCGRFLGQRQKSAKASFYTEHYCPNCGQALDWSGVVSWKSRSEEAAALEERLRSLPEAPKNRPPDVWIPAKRGRK